MYNNTFHRHMADVETLAAHGVPAPAEWLGLRERFAAYVELATPISDRLAAEILDPGGGDGGDVATLRALALAEQSATSVEDEAVNEIIRRAVHGRMVEIYRPHAERAYRTIAKRFDSAAAAFVNAAKLVDVEADAATLVRAPQRDRDAWFAAPTLAGACDDWLAVLMAAGRLAGTPAADDDTEIEITLTVDAKWLHRRRVWEAWNATGRRAGRWSALHTLGAEIRAHGKPERLEPYRAPKPLEMRWTQGVHGGGEKLIIDPEDNPNAARAVGDWSAV